MEKLEKDIQSLILTDLRSMGKYCICFKIIKTSDNGIGDIFFSTKKTGGVFVETKRPKGIAEKLQKNKAEKLNNCGSKAFFCYSWNEWIELKNKLGLNTRNLSL